MSNDYEVYDERFNGYVLPNAPLVCLGDGFGWTEGPVWFADLQCLLFSDVPNNRVMRWTSSGGVSVFREPSQFENGHTRDRQGRLVSCSHRDRGITRTELDGTVTMLADRFDGRRLNSPNDVVVKSDGSIWFSDPPYGINTDYEGGKQIQERPATVYRLDPAGRELSIVADDLVGPNGLCFSPDEAVLYVVETGRQFDPKATQYIRAYDVEAGSQLRNGRVFHSVKPGNADGICCDQDGNLWSSAGDGVHCIAPDGTLLGKIKLPFTVSNLTFGGRNRSQLFICASHALFTISTNQRGVVFP
ncbi:SMP-30/gluconolactonase/LRE family protein [Lichenihabitans sp. Uapishka_5]|uniref:SMP-30/gluconolactonase/LRE family protein n=1 Tax=Lichenihabitans sp. Uapishka_5 TaxID=3037302 RepID=UPI0029E7F2E7|nr:SMP-30/gluconolactonase/LRE family protein [Lichenihabitans sp. Uapishka_5]MDX7949724.1 SMP-30/gluconolactonase/LRE family protein [Lichenihabitans sp. Uapishka_5]